MELVASLTVGNFVWKIFTYDVGSMLAWEFKKIGYKLRRFEFTETLPEIVILLLILVQLNLIIYFQYLVPFFINDVTFPFLNRKATN